jgi:hypothetical protein
LDNIEEERIRAHVFHLAGLGSCCEERPDVIRDTIAHLTTHLQEAGYIVRAEPCGAGPQVNLIAEIRGRRDACRVLEYAAHYDNVPDSPGADDNASGVAGLLELARVLANVPIERTIRFCFFAMEEVDKRGSREHVRILDATQHEVVDGTVVFEMIGFRTALPGSQRAPFRFPFVLWPPTTGDFIAVISNASSIGTAELFVKAARRHVPDLRLYTLKRLGGFLKDAVRSDHVSYWRAGRKSIMLTDTANFRNPNYHKPDDAPETLDYRFVCQIVQASAGMALEWANPVTAGN